MHGAIFIDNIGILMGHGIVDKLSNAELKDGKFLDVMDNIIDMMTLDIVELMDWVQCRNTPKNY